MSWGDLAIVGFLGEINKIEPGKLEQLRSLLQESGAGIDASG